MWGPSVKVEAEFSEAEGAPSEEGQRALAQKCAQDVFSHGKAVFWLDGIGVYCEVLSWIKEMVV